jgi:hypothetical protein
VAVARAARAAPAAAAVRLLPGGPAASAARGAVLLRPHHAQAVGAAGPRRHPGLLVHGARRALQHKLLQARQLTQRREVLLAALRAGGGVGEGGGGRVGNGGAAAASAGQAAGPGMGAHRRRQASVPVPASAAVTWRTAGRRSTAPSARGALTAAAPRPRWRRVAAARRPGYRCRGTGPSEAGQGERATQGGGVGRLRRQRALVLSVARGWRHTAKAAWATRDVPARAPPGQAAARGGPGCARPSRRPGGASSGARQGGFRSGPKAGEGGRAAAAASVGHRARRAHLQRRQLGRALQHVQRAGGQLGIIHHLGAAGRGGGKRGAWDVQAVTEVRRCRGGGVARAQLPGSRTRRRLVAPPWLFAPTPTPSPPTKLCRLGSVARLARPWRLKPSGLTLTSSDVSRVRASSGAAWSSVSP